MITEDLTNYIKSQIEQNISKEVIVSKLAQVGWKLEDIEEALAEVIQPIKTEVKSDLISETQKEVEEKREEYKVDPYHEPIDLGSDPLATNLEIEKNKSNKVESLSPSTEMLVEEKKEETSKIWTPTTIKPIIEDLPPLENKEVGDIPKEDTTVKSVSTRTIETFQLELNKPKEDKKPDPVKLPVEEIKIEGIQEEIEKIPNLIPKMTSQDVKKEDPSWDIPTQQSPEPKSAVKPELKSEPVIKKIEDNIDPSQIKQNRISDMTSSLSKKAMISSYSQDYMSANKLKEEVSKRKKSILSGWLIWVGTFIVLVGIVLMFTEGFIKIPKFDLSFVKKDPKIVLLNSTNNLSLLKSYKVGTKVSISFPSFSNITSSLMEGENLSFQDKDSFSFKADGIVDKKNSTSIFFDYDIVLNSSIIEDEIKTNFKYDGRSSFVNVPDLSKSLGEKSPLVGLVSIPNEQLDEINLFLPASIQEKVGKIELSKLLPNSFSDITGSYFSLLFKNFIGGVEMIKKGEQDIGGILTYNYSLSVDRVFLKKFLSDILNVVLPNLSNEEKLGMDQILGSASVDSFEVWIGKKDGNLYKYKFKLAVPLSKVIGLDDKTMANNSVVLDWETKYFDLDLPNSVTIPVQTIGMDDFVNNINDTKIKNLISSFSVSANVMKNALGNYGKKSNSKGSCVEPTSGSLFSPLGHTKGASTVVGTIASIMNEITSQTQGVSACYSTSKNWAIASPLISDPDSYFCSDSEGNSVILNESLTGTVCPEIITEQE